MEIILTSIVCGTIVLMTLIITIATYKYSVHEKTAQFKVQEEAIRSANAIRHEKAEELDRLTTLFKENLKKEQGLTIKQS